VALYLCYRTYLYNSAVRRPYGAPLPPEAPYQVHEPQNKSGCQISVAVQLLARHLEVNCYYKICEINRVICEFVKFVFIL